MDPYVIPEFPLGYVEEDRGPRTIGAAVSFIVLEIIFVSLRITSRRTNRTPIGLDDVLIIPALIFCLGICTLAIIEVKIAGVGRHMDVLSVINPRAFINWAKCGYAVEQLYCTAVVFPKLSILASYLRIFATKPYRITTYVVAGIIIANGVAGVVTSLASCKPFSARWDPTLTNTHCIDYLPYWRWISLPNIITDVVMLVLPLPVIWNLQVSKAQKYGLTFVFLTGSVGLVASIIRFATFFNVKALSDGTYVSADLAAWSLIEPGFYLIAACLPSLRPLILSAFNRVSGTIDSKRAQKYSNTSTSSAGEDISMKGGISKPLKMGECGSYECRAFSP